MITRGLLISFMDLDADLGINHWLGGFGDIVKFPSLSVGAGLVSFDLPVFFFGYMEALIVKILMGF